MSMNIANECIKLGGVAGRHEIPGVKNFVLDKVDDPGNIEKITADVVASLDNQDLSNGLDLYVTGLTSVTVAVIKYCFDNNIPLTCFHFDVVKKVYIPQEVL
ncbi:MAG: hypothetical protein MR726_02510 [Ligilactobacillus salivarius]|nr:hypothetical protein [Ligilactobacillus salivarius]MCI6062295.1 hypothetical protein [Ligilactobacillus salivarius]